MVNLPTTDKVPVPQVQAPQSKVSAQQVASPYLELADTFDLAAKESGEAAKRLAREAGLTAVTRDADGNVVVQKAPIVGDAALEYRHAVQTAAVADGEEVIRADLTRMRHEFRDDPAGFAKAAETYRREKVAQYQAAAGPAVGVTLGKVAGNMATEFHSGLLTQKEQLDLHRATASIDAQIKGTENELFALAAGGDTTSPAYVERLQKVGALWGQLVRNPRLAIPAERADYAIGKLGGELHLASEGYRIGLIQRSQGDEAAFAEAQKILTDPRLNLPPAERFAAYTRLMHGLQGQTRLRENGDRRLTQDIDRLGARAAEGVPPVPAEIGRIRSVVDQRGNPELSERLREVEAIAPTLTAWSKASPAQLEADLATFERTIRETGGGPTMNRLVAAGHALLRNMRQGITSDQLGWADKTGHLTVPDLVLSGDGAMPSMAQRVADAESIATDYRTRPAYLKPHEKIALTEAVKAGGDSMLAAAQTVVQGFGDRAPRVLAEISKDSPVLAHVGALMTTGAAPAFLRDVAEAERLKANPEFKHPRWLDKDDGTIATEQDKVRVEAYGGAFVLVPDTGRAADMAAKAAFYTRSYRNGYDPKFVDNASASKTAYERALQESAGAVYGPDGTQFGGVASYGTRPGTWFASGRVLIPGNMRADKFGDVMGAIKDEDLARAAISPVTAQGTPVSAATLRKALPVATRGGYRFALGDPSGDDPKWINGADGNPFVLDLEGMESTLRGRVPGAYAAERR